MIIFLIILTIFLVLALLGGGAIWFALRHRLVAISQGPTEQVVTAKPLAFRWQYIIGPGVVLLLSIILVIVFFPRLPVDVAYHFGPDGSPDQWLGRGLIILWTLLPQFLLTVLAGAIVWGTASLGALFKQAAATELILERIPPLMGNMIALPQFILCFAMLDIFSYNSYQIRIMPLWIFALIIMSLGAIILAVFFIRAFQQSWGAPR